MKAPPPAAAAFRLPPFAKAFRLPASPKAFSLLELLIVMTLIGLITAVAMPNFWRSLAPVQARSSVNKIAAILRHARSQAVARQEVCRVLFDLPGQRVVLLAGSAATGAGGETYRLPESISLQPAGAGGGEKNGSFQINFYPGGNSSGGELTLAGKSGRVYRVKVDFITGITEVL